MNQALKAIKGIIPTCAGSTSQLAEVQLGRAGSFSHVHAERVCCALVFQTGVKIT